MFGGFAADGTRFNPIETNLGVAEVSTLQAAWVGPTGGGVQSSPAWADGRVFVGSLDGNLYAFTGNGTQGCGGTPLTCAPLWTALLPAATTSSPAVVDGLVYIASGGTLLVFDAKGVTNCSGGPKVCQPLWTAAGGGFGSPVVDSGRVFVGGNDTLSAFDAAGVSGCGGTPKTCAPLWTFTADCGPIGIHCDLASPSVHGGVVYVGAVEGDERGGSGEMYAFSAAGTTGCAGVPRVCQPLWRTPLGEVTTAPSIDGSTLYFTSSTVTIEFTGARYLNAVNAATGALRWRVETTTSFSTPATAYGRVFLSDFGGLKVFDAAGNLVRRGTAGSNRGGSPFVSDGVVYVTGTNELAAFDAVGDRGCPMPPGPCTPIWTTALPGAERSSPIENVGTVYIGASDGALHAFRPT